MDISANTNANKRNVEITVSDQATTIVVLLVEAEEASQLAAEIDAAVTELRS